MVITLTEFRFNHHSCKSKISPLICGVEPENCQLLIQWEKFSIQRQKVVTPLLLSSYTFAIKFPYSCCKSPILFPYHVCPTWEPTINVSTTETSQIYVLLLVQSFIARSNLHLQFLMHLKWFLKNYWGIEPTEMSCSFIPCRNNKDTCWSDLVRCLDMYGVKDCCGYCWNQTNTTS